MNILFFKNPPFFLRNVKFVEVGLEMRKTLMIMKVPRVLCRELELKRHFAEAYPDVTVKNVTFAYDVKKLQAIHSELKDAKSALRYCNKHNALDKEEFFVYRVSFHLIKTLDFRLFYSL